MPNEPTAHNQQAEAYQRHLPEMKALPASDVLTPTVDVTAMTSLLFGILPNIARYRDTFGKLEGIRAEAFTNLESYAHALNHADGEYLIASDATPEAIAIALAAGEIRNRISLAAQLLLASRVITEAEMPELKGGKGYLNLARDITALAALIRANLEKAKAKGGLLVSEADLDEAVDTASKLLAVVGQREHSVNEVAEATQLRNRAYTLAYNAYDEVRRGISYYRWYERDIDTFLPTIHTLNQRSRTSQTGGARPADPVSGSGNSNGNVSRPAPAPFSHEAVEASGEGNEPDGYDKDGPFRK